MTTPSSPSPTLADLLPTIDSSELAVHHRTIDMSVYERDGYFVLVGTLHDERPWSDGGRSPRDLHRMELSLVVRRADLVIVDAAATMGTFPHAECTDIEGDFHDLVGLSVSRGYTSAVQARFGRQRGCSHLEFLARALGPVVIQAITSSRARHFFESGAADVPGATESQPAGDGQSAPGGELGWILNTCHVWADDGPGPQKLAVGWRPGLGEYPAPSFVEIRRRLGGAEA